MHNAGEGSEGDSSGGGGGDALGLGYGSDGEEAEEESPSAAVTEEASDTGKQEAEQNPLAAVKQEEPMAVKQKENHGGGEQGSGPKKGEAAPVQEEPLAAATGKPIAPRSTAEAAVVKDDDADKPQTVGSQPSLPSTVPAEVQGAAPSGEELAVGQPTGLTGTPPVAAYRRDPAHASGLTANVVPDPTPATNSSEAGGEPAKPTYSKGDR